MIKNNEPIQYRVCAFTTAYNDAQALSRCLQAILAQSYDVLEILVIDNSPSPLLKYDDFERVQSYHCPENLGVAGAFRLALGWSQSRSYDFLWSFDQDSEPADNCLEQLLFGFHQHHDPVLFPIAQVAPLILDTRTNRYVGGATFNRFRFQELNLRTTTSQLYVKCDAPITSGCLISMAAACRVQPPKDGLFIDGIDLDFGMKLRQIGFYSLIVFEAKMVHKLGEPLKIFWSGKSRYIQNYSPLRSYYFFRNHTYLELLYSAGLFNRTLAFVYRLNCLLKELVSTILYRPYKLAKCQAALLGTYHGLIGRLNEIDKN